MNLETRKINLINWISTLQDEKTLEKMEKIQEERNDWWDNLNEEDKSAITDGISQLDSGKYMTRSQVRSRINERFNI